MISDNNLSNKMIIVKMTNDRKRDFREYKNTEQKTRCDDDIEI